MPIRSISVIGIGKLGSCIAATFAQRGFKVVGIDVDAEKVRLLNNGQPPVDEPLLAETILAARDNLRASQDASEAVKTDASFFIPPSSSLPDGSFSNEFLLRAMRLVAQAVAREGKKGHLFVINSTTTPGAIEKVLIPALEKETGWKCPKDFGVCYNPEFIALGNVVQGLLEPDLVLIGESDPQSGQLLEEVYRKYNLNQPKIFRMSIVSAELAKISLNSYITMKISYTNQLRLIAEKHPGADINAILNAIGHDSRIGTKYLLPGLSYGGPCFPRDNRLISYVAKQAGLEAPLAEAADRMNQLTKAQLVEQVKRFVKKGETIAVLGMAYRPNTYIIEESAGLYLAEQMKNFGCHVLVHDFAATPKNTPALSPFEFIESVDKLQNLENLNAVVICCPWKEYQSLKIPENIKLLDPWNLLSKK
jgi:UDPglucose 6-dehydrogenase